MSSQVQVQVQLSSGGGSRGITAPAIVESGNGSAGGACGGKNIISLATHCQAIESVSWSGPQNLAVRAIESIGQLGPEILLQ